MDNERQETIADIVSDIRAQNLGLPEDSYALSPLVCDLLSLARRIEVANAREREVGAEAARTAAQLDLGADLHSVSCLLKRKVVWNEDVRI